MTTSDEPQREPQADPEEVAELFAEALEQPPAARRALLEARCAGSEVLRREVGSLLAAHSASGTFLQGLDGDGGAALLRATPEADGPGQRIGPYLLLSELGRGGMGVVYLGERVDGGFEQKAAVKLIKRGLDSDAILRRFLRERQILAALDHPGIARLFEGGATQDGRPYFAMEYVDGLRLNAYCSAHQLGVEGRLRLFIQAARAVQHAHTRLVVHRDLKPSNILVTGDGQVKLLDFGVAQLLAGDEHTEPATVTLAGERPLTPHYAAPELLHGDAVTTAADVYALGVVLYELLSGRRPHEAAGRSPLAQADQPADPRAPSTAVTEGGCGLTRERLGQRLRGDLDTIVLKALAPDPARRYSSVEAFVDDLGRHLAGFPVRARRDTVRYRASRFVRRHRVGVAAAAVAVAGLLLGLAGTLWQARRARQEAARARAVQRFLVDVFERSNPTRSLGETVSARELLDEGARRLREDTSADAATRAELADTLARTYRSLGRLDEALAWANEGQAGFSATLGADHPRTALAQLTAAEVISARGDVRTARPRLDALVSRLGASYGQGSPEHVRARVGRAELLLHTGELERALAEEHAILESVEQASGSASMDSALQLGRVATALHNLSRFDEAEATYRDAIARLAKARGARSPQGIQLETNLADLLDRMGRVEEAEAHFVSALSAGRAVLGSRHPQVADILIKYGFLHNELGRSAQGDAALVEAISILEPLGHYDAASALQYRGYELRFAERHAEALEAFTRAERILRARLGDDDLLTWQAAMNVAYTQVLLGQVAEGEARLRAAVAALERIHGAESNDVRIPKKFLGEVCRLAGRPAEAESLHRWALALEQRLFGDQDGVSRASTRNQLALDLLAQGGNARLAEARALSDDAMRYVRANRVEPARVADCLFTSGRIAAAQGDVGRARRELAEALERALATRGVQAPSTLAVRKALAALPAPRARS